MIGFFALVGIFGLLALATLWGVSRTQAQFPPQGSFLEVDGVRLHYREAGTGAVLVLIHGSSGNLRDFSNSIFAPLSKTHRVIAIDRPGHGYSERPRGAWPDPERQAALIHGLLQQLEVKDPILVGHSWSGSLVLAYLLAFPEDAAAAVLLAGATHPWVGGVAWYNNLAGVPLLGDVFARTLVYPLGSQTLESAIAGVFAPNVVPAGYSESTGVILSLRPEVFLANAEDARGLSEFLAVQSQHYGEIKQPLLLLTGEEDNIVPAWNHSDRLARQALNSEQVSFAATGHALHHVHSARVVALIEDFSRRQHLPLRQHDSKAADRAERMIAPKATLGAH
uniref:alpha/beta fold hydrolase n=1 Tax=Marinobacterium profundum TaxID=1714300 RepID=UPI000829B353|nr:alpha/beta hydrolase [Marinobacterium profundum]